MLPFVDRGTGSGVLLLHGFGLDSRTWEPQIEALRDRHRLIAVDLPGFGPKPARVAAGTSAARAAIEVLDALSVDRVHVVGHSLGGAVAADLALTFPHRLRTLVLVGPLFRGRDTGLVAWERAATHAREGRVREAGEAWLSDPLFTASLENPAAAASLRAMAADYGGAHWRGEMKTTYESEASPGARLADLRAPTLVVVGEREVPAFRAMADEYATTVPHAKKVVIPGAGHVPSLEAPEAFTAELRAFFEA